ncbi:YjhT family mutarotase [Vibrio parahaemolyticus]|uniref:YjhT family mutarotase n=1 Tax=Vibrio mediterranei TaxID=689 RepID=UPI004067FE92
MTIHLTFLPDFPIAIKNGVGGSLGRRLYAGLGSAGKHFFYFDLNQPGGHWQPAPGFPGAERNDAVSVTTSEGLYVFSGAGNDPRHAYTSVLMDSYFFCANKQQWHSLDTTLPLGLLGASAIAVNDHQFLFWGGYCKETFDALMKQLSQASSSDASDKHINAFMGQPIEAYGWNSHIWLYDVRKNTWEAITRNPYPANCGAALVRINDDFMLIEGEVKPGLRSLKTKCYQFDHQWRLTTKYTTSIADQWSHHEGIAGGYGSAVDNSIILAGGAYFIGSQANFQQGKLYSHQGLRKHYSDTIWRYQNGEWEQTGKLPIPSAYGISIPSQDGLYVLGGETLDGQTLSCCYHLKAI